jgi:DNA-binding NarL/FixJ family response regulator
LAATQACPPDVVVLDMRLPDAVGPRLIRRIHLLAPAARVILLTPEDGPEYGELAARWGAAAHLSWDQVDQALLRHI